MDGANGGAARAAPSSSPWHLSTSPRRHMYSFASSMSAAPNASDTSSTSARSPTVSSRRRRVLGRLVRSGSDPRNSSSSCHHDHQDLLCDSVAKTPSKRKAPSFSKSTKSLQTRSAIERAPASNMDPPMIRLEDVMPSNLTTHSATLVTSMRDLADSSEDELDDFDLAIVQSMHRPGRRASADLRSRMRLVEEARRRHDANRMLSAVLVAPQPDENAAVLSGGVTDRLRYLPLCPASAHLSRSDANNSNLLTVLPAHCDFVERARSAEQTSTAIWPLDQLPVELFDLITLHLARDDVKAMRLVNREFEQKVSRSLFHTAVVPFNTEIYDMIDEERKTNNRSPPAMDRPKGKMRALSQDMDSLGAMLEPPGLKWENAKEDKEGKVYRGHGLRVFRGFGPHIKRFGMSFEISEKQLSRPPIKKELDHIESYHGSYDWPSETYARFATLAGLENTADETSRMKAAFSNLEIVQEVALSIDSGLGWLNGSDKSLRAIIFEQPSPVFGRSYRVPDHAAQAANEFWTALQQSQMAFDPHSNLKEITLDYRPSASTPTEVDGLRDNLYSNTQLWSAADSVNIVSALSNHFTGNGVFYTTYNPQRGDDSQKFPLMPGSLSKEQREWLLETQWAQQAFLESYMLAVMDNPATFCNVTTLNIANASSRFLPMLAREAFWDRLPQLFEVVLRVSPDWRTVDKDEAGFAQTTNKFPSDAVRFFHKDVLQSRVAGRESIKKLTIGWVGGGEHAEGMFARNNNLLPAPITRVDHCTANSSLFGVIFHHVEHLTLSNCWITPPGLEGLVKGHASKALRKLTLDSVSLTAHPKFPNNMQGVGAQNIVQAMAAVHAHLANPNAAAAAQQPGANPGQQPLQQFALLHQQVGNQLHQLQQMQQQGNANQNNHPAPGVAPAPPWQVHAQAPLPPSPTPADHNNGHWSSGHREGSWPDILNTISPGPVFTDYLPGPAPWEEPLPPRPETNLRTLEFNSCGYVKLLHHTGFDQFVLDPGTLHPRYHQSSWFRQRYNSLKGAMMSTSDRNLGQIVQYIPPRELDALQFAWGLTEGWQDHVKAAEAEFDGFAPGGTGRFSGVVDKGMELVARSDAGGGGPFLADNGN